MVSDVFVSEILSAKPFFRPTPQPNNPLMEGVGFRGGCHLNPGYIIGTNIQTTRKLYNMGSSLNWGPFLDPQYSTAPRKNHPKLENYPHAE